MSCQDSELADFEQSAVEIAKKAGKIISDTCGKISSIEQKQSYADLVTETDKNVERMVFDFLKAKYPSHKFIGEEGVANEGAPKDSIKAGLSDEPTWIVDPVDGTTNFVHTLPFVAVCIGMTIKKQLVLGVVYCPALEQLYTARKGQGAYCNGRRIQVKPSQGLKDSLVCMEMGSDRSEEKKACVFANMQSIGWQCHGIRALGSAAMNMCAVASGQANAFVEFGLHCWDMCAPGCILEEAGGCLRDTTGAQFDLMNRRIIAASSPQLAKEIAENLVVQMDLPRD